MKWEIFKGSENDFEGAPEWALSVYSVSALTGHLQAFSGAGMYQYLDGYSGTEDAGKAKEGNFASLGWRNTPKIIAERRPITETAVNQQVTTEWSGEGLPPVGVECEMLWNDEWVKCAVKAYGDEQFIFKADGHREWAGHISNFSFRPIRSHEDVTRARVRSQECDKIFSILSGVERQGNRSDMAEAVYDAGYRKVE